MITMTFPNLNWYPNCMNWPWKERTDKGQFRLSSYWTARTITEPRFPRKKEKRKSSVFSSSNILGVNGNQFSITPLLPYAYSAKGLSQRFPSATKQGFQFFIIHHFFELLLFFYIFLLLLFYSIILILRASLSPSNNFFLVS